MKHLLLGILIVVGLSGLIVIQYNLVKVGVLLEKERFDQKMELVLQEVEHYIDQDETLRQQLMQFYYKRNNGLASPEYLLPRMVRDTLYHVIHSRMARHGLTLDHSFALSIGPGGAVFLASDDFRQESFSYERFGQKLKGKLLRDCHCDIYLQVHMNNLFNFLLGRLANLIIPSLIFILLLVICVITLINGLNKLRRLDYVKNDFINNLTHELKTPVFSLSLLGRLLRNAVNEGRTEKANEYIDLIEKENEHMKHQIEKVLELASLEDGRHALELRAVDLPGLLSELADQFAHKIERKKGRLIRQFQDGLPALEIDPGHFRNAVQNLLENALKYNDNKPEIVLSLQQEQNSVFLDIKDNGIGIPAEHQKRIFEKFYRVTRGDLHRVKGFGLGLSYVRQIVEAHGGHISLDSQPGRGSVFRIQLPTRGRRELLSVN